MPRPIPSSGQQRKPSTAPRMPNRVELSLPPAAAPDGGPTGGGGGVSYVTGPPSSWGAPGAGRHPPPRSRFLLPRDSRDWTLPGQGGSRGRTVTTWYHLRREGQLGSVPSRPAARKRSPH